MVQKFSLFGECVVRDRKMKQGSYRLYSLIAIGRSYRLFMVMELSVQWL
jgi:hypothetical protein